MAAYPLVSDLWRAVRRVRFPQGLLGAVRVQQAERHAPPPLALSVGDDRFDAWFVSPGRRSLEPVEGQGSSPLDHQPTVVLTERHHSALIRLTRRWRPVATSFVWSGSVPGIRMGRSEPCTEGDPRRPWSHDNPRRIHVSTRVEEARPTALTTGG